MKILSLQETVLLLLALSPCLSTSLPTRKSKPEDLVATDSQIQFADTNGELKTSVNTDNSYRAESRQPDGSVKGVYGWISPNGEPVQVAFKSDAQNGYRTFSGVDKLDVNLPPLPSKLYESEEEEREEIQETSSSIQASLDEEEIAPRQRYRLPQSRSNIFQAAIDDDGEENFVILEDDSLVRDGGDDDDSAVFLEGGDGSEGSEESPKPGSGSKVEIIEGYEQLLSDLKPGTPVAQSNPSVSAIAGTLGVAHADPRSSAIVGPGGVAISLPKGQALVGPGGIAISAPKSSSQAGPGGIAIASVYSTAVAGIQPPGDDEIQGPGGDPGFFKRDTAGMKTESFPLLQGAAAPFITNYFFQFRMPDYYGAADIDKVLEKFSRGSSPTRSQVSGRRSSHTNNISSSSSSESLPPQNVYYEAPDLQSLSAQA